LAVVPLRMPPLRERKGDIPILVEHFLKKYSKLLGKNIREISSYAMKVLMDYHFPGNVRELENIIERGVALENSAIILPESLTLSNRATGRAGAGAAAGLASDALAAIGEEELLNLGLEQCVINLEKTLIRFALEQTGGAKMQAADLLRMSFRSFRYKLSKYGID